MKSGKRNSVNCRGFEMNLCKKIDSEFYCIAKNRKQQFSCTSGKLDDYDDCCQYGFYMDVCKIGDLIEIDQQTQDEDAKL